MQARKIPMASINLLRLLATLVDGSIDNHQPAPNQIYLTPFS